MPNLALSLVVFFGISKASLEVELDGVERAVLLAVEPVLHVLEGYRVFGVLVVIGVLAFGRQLVKIIGEDPATV